MEKLMLKKLKQALLKDFEKNQMKLNNKKKLKKRQMMILKIYIKVKSQKTVWQFCHQKELEEFQKLKTSLADKLSELKLLEIKEENQT